MCFLGRHFGQKEYYTCLPEGIGVEFLISILDPHTGIESCWWMISVPHLMLPPAE